MEIHHRPCGVEGVSLLAVDGGLDHSNKDRFVETMDQVLAEGTLRAVLDLERLTYVSSWGLAALVKVHHHWATRGGRIVFANLHSAVATLLHVSRMDRFFDLYDSVDDALKAVSEPKTAPDDA
jgi:anti-sigma B factor antagonist